MVNAPETARGLSPAPAFSALGPVAPGVSRLGVVFVNTFAIEGADGRWVLVDTGLPACDGWVRRVMEGRFGAANPPAAIVLTHAHFDHAGGARALADAWDVPVYAHEKELPYLTGRSDYPPADPTPGGAICFLSRFFPTSGYDLGGRVHPLPADGSVPGLPGWRWVHTPGHTAGHVSLFRDDDRTLIAGDVLCTTDLDSWVSQVTWAREFRRPATPFTPDWEAIRRSLDAVAGLNPHTVAAGHGLPISGPDAAEALRAFVRAMAPPPNGRYTGRPPQFAADGSLVAVPPPVPDPLPGRLLLGAAAAAAGLAAWAMLRPRRHVG